MYLRSQNLILLSKWPLMTVLPIPLPATMSLQLEPANRVLVPGMGMERLNHPDQNNSDSHKVINFYIMHTGSKEILCINFVG